MTRNLSDLSARLEAGRRLTIERDTKRPYDLSFKTLTGRVVFTVNMNHLFDEDGNLFEDNLS